jgi:hypothetical protein
MSQLNQARGWGEDLLVRMNSTNVMMDLQSLISPDSDKPSPDTAIFFTGRQQPRGIARPRVLFARIEPEMVRCGQVRSGR